MKHNKNHDHAPGADPQLMPVHFEFTDPKARSVCVAGTFNQWRPERETLHHSAIGRWFKDMALAPGAYEYCLIVDGHWRPDPQARETVPNPFGGRNSVLNVSSMEAIHLAEAEIFPLKMPKDNL